MNKAAGLILLAALAFPSFSSGQTPTTDQDKGTSSSKVDPSRPYPLPKFERPVSWKSMLPNILNDQKQIWSFPMQLTHGNNWLPTTAVVGTAAGLMALDPYDASYFRRTNSFQGFNQIFSGKATAIGTAVPPLSLYLMGLIRKDEKMLGTSLLATEAVIDAEILTTFLKDTTRRVRPSGVSAQGNFSDTLFESKNGVLSGGGGMPSGHSIAAFAVATVIARRYGNHRWVPFVAYGLATLVGFSRVSTSAHFVSDVFVGGALGYSISRYVVLR